MSAVFMTTFAAIVASASPPVLPTGDPAQFAIAGIKLGMSPDAVRTEMMRTGYRVGFVNHLESYGSQVAARIADLRHQARVAKNDATSEIQATGPSSESLTVSFVQWPDGPHAIVVSFRADPARQLQDAFKAQVEGKYGKPSGRAFGVWRWCSRGEMQCGPVATPALPSLDADYQMRSLILKRGSEAASAQKAMVETEARKAVPLQSGSAF